MSKAQDTRARIIEQAATLFNQQGYSGASMSALMQLTGLQKGGIYNHFDSKDELALAAFDFAIHRIQQKFIGALNGKRHAADRLIAILNVYGNLLDDPFLQGGCPILNTAVESDDTHPALRERAKKAADAWRSLIQRIVEKGVMRKELHSTVDPENVSSILIATIEGAIMLTKLYEDTAHLHRALTHLDAYVRQLARTG
ncbi:TetR/AcrR family transcriptional regulator [Altericista sp. CCNU0014]|uniref:TetR/AcrR family transcriptional regulator n=1 Tax=Altericista sp. CCNU0014 TaxID=3082949 RepID=UPI00384DD854